MSSEPGGARKLIYIPIVHTQADMGTLAASIRGTKLSVLGRQGVARQQAAVEEMWQQIERTLARMEVPAGTRVYQDGLPVCGREPVIVSDLAQAGSRNHKLLLALRERGAILMGTESPELLLEEYQLATAAFGAPSTARKDFREKQLRDALLEKRDRYIAQRVNTTLPGGQTGMLFLGMLHNVAPYLAADITAVYPLGRPRR